MDECPICEWNDITYDRNTWTCKDCGSSGPVFGNTHDEGRKLTRNKVVEDDYSHYSFVGDETIDDDLRGNIVGIVFYSKPKGMHIVLRFRKDYDPKAILMVGGDYLLEGLDAISFKTFDCELVMPEDY